MEKINLTERRIAAEEPAPHGQRREIADAQVPGLRLRLNHKIKLKIKWDGDSSPIFLPQGQYIFYAPARKGAPATRRSLGSITAMRLSEARQRAREIRMLIEAGKDPDEVEAAERAAEEARKKAEAQLAEDTFGKAMEQYMLRLKGQRQGEKVKGDIERDLLPFWRDRPLREITKADVRKRIVEILEGKNRGIFKGKKTKPRKASPRQARKALSNLKTFFNWAEDEFDLPSIPTSSKGLSKLVPPLKPRKRTLGDIEIIAFWRAADEEGDPLGPGYKELLITGARLNEIFEAQKNEIVPRGNRGRLLEIPPERFKSDCTHLIPLSGLASDILDEMTVWQKCKFIFSRDGKTPAKVRARDRKRLNKSMLRILKEMAVDRGDDPEQVELKPFVLHDLRRTVRTRLSALKVDDTVAELMIGHGRRGMQRVYDQYKFENEMLEAQELWVSYLMRLLNPSPQEPKLRGNVIELEDARSRISA